MKIFFDNVAFNNNSGPNTFATRLAKAFVNKQHTLADYCDYDVALAFIQTAQANNTKPVAQRLDGIWFAPHEFQHKNVQIKHTYVNANLVIWQSQFDKNMTIKWWGQPKSGVVIHNGVDDRDVEITNHGLIELRQKAEKIFVCASHWHPQKRLKDNMQMFLHLLRRWPESYLIVLGETDYVLRHPRILYAGDQDHETCLQVYKIADWMIHLAWLDHCPNVVVEALSQGTPVICSEAGGTSELVCDFGVVLHEQHQYDFDLVEYDKPPPLDLTQVVDLPDINFLGKHTNVNIEFVADKYIDALRNLVNDDV